MRLADGIAVVLLLGVGGYVAWHCHSSRVAPRRPLAESELEGKTGKCLREGHDWCMRPADCAIRVSQRSGAFGRREHALSGDMVAFRRASTVIGLMRHAQTEEQRLAMASRILIEVDIAAQFSDDQRVQILSQLVKVMVSDDSPRVQRFIARYVPHVLSRLRPAEDPRRRERARVLSKQFMAAAAASPDPFIREQARACADLIGASNAKAQFSAAPPE